MRIRTVKPEFWESETIASLSIEARLLFLATLNAADDEGLLRWNAALLKSLAFIYDDEICTERVSEWMSELVREELIQPYKGGKTNTMYGWIVSFREHQKINRPQQSKLPAPSLQNAKVREAYARRDHYICQISGLPIESLSQRTPGDKFSLSLDHIKPRSKGGSDHPSNIRATIQKANKGRGDNEEYQPSDYVMGGVVNDSVNHSVSDSVSERNGMEGERNGIGKEVEGSGDENSAASHLPMIEKIVKAYPKQSHFRESREAVEAAIDRNARRQGKSKQDSADDILTGTAAIAKKLREWPIAERNKYAPTPPNFFNGDRWADDPESFESRQGQKPDDGDNTPTNLGGRTPRKVIDLRNPDSDQNGN